MKQIYLDYAAATPLAPAVKEAMLPYLDEAFYNPSAQYLAAQNVAHEVEKARASIAHWLGCRPIELTFTAGGTEANNLAIHGLMRCYPEGNMVFSAIEHEAVIEPAKRYPHTAVAVTDHGLIDLDALAGAINNKTVLVSVMYANNEIGTVQPLKKVAQLVRTERARRQKSGNNLPIYLHTDACQAGAYLDLHVNRLGVDMMTINAGKIYGPKQCGALYVRSGIELEPQISGGGQERGRRSGTESVANIIGFATALELVQNNRHHETERLQDLQAHFIKSLQEHMPDVTVNGSLKHRLPNNIHITVPGTDNERLMMQLDEQGVQCAVGSACSASNDEPSHVLQALGLSEEAAQSSLRFTMGLGTTKADVDYTVRALMRSTKS